MERKEKVRGEAISRCLAVQKHRAVCPRYDAGLPRVSGLRMVIAEPRGEAGRHDQFSER
jgi:hypothetical protein